jgi:hypothetical protein
VPSHTCRQLHLDWQVSAVAQICNSLNQIFSAVEHLTLQNEVHSQSSEEHNEVDRIEWRKILRSFSNVKTLRVKDGLDKEIARCLQLEDGELPLDLLPELHELTCSGSRDTGDLFTSFINARQDAGRSITLVQHFVSTVYEDASSERTGSFVTARSDSDDEGDEENATVAPIVHAPTVPS